MLHRISTLTIAAALAVAAQLNPARAVELELPTYQLQEGFGVWWQAAAAAFAEENPGHTIKLVGAPFGDHHDQLTTRFVAGNPPDIAHISARFMFGFADSGFLEPLDERLAEIGWNEDDFIAPQQQMKRNDKVYGQLLLGYAWGLFYNQAMLEAAGVAVPTTPEEFVAAAKALTLDTDGDGRIDQYGFPFVTDQSSQTYFALTYLLAGLGHGWTSDGALIARDDLREAIAMTAELIEVEATPVGLGSNEMRQLFWQGRAAMYIDGSWAPAFKKDAEQSVAENYRVAPLPFPDEAGGPSNVLAIPAALDDERKALAFKFIELIQRPEWQQAYGEMSGNPPARIGMLTDKARADWPEIPVFEASAARATHSYLPEGLEGEYNKFSAIVSEGISALASGALDVDGATDQIHAELAREFF
ncbi:extracellular solute-binding protein [Hoeflea sp.]|uniref:ABC transporter substrate-binding protein n=1 Tax=Hoeflea sp. TaxID=1940281 RepID=UPI0019B0D4E8|nr:extracellular solute-binding protein [Hoeflea sp.]MBC7282199.1 extracellular solute-binding protein [Hoeflea sp.]